MSGNAQQFGAGFGQLVSGTARALGGLAEVIAASEEAFRPLVTDALRSFERPRESALTLPGAAVRDFLAWVAGRVDEAVEAEGGRTG